MYLGGQRVDLKKLTMPLLNFYGAYDHLVPPDACNQLTKVVGSTDVEDVCFETGHIGIYVSSKIQKQFAPKIVQWLKERDTENMVGIPDKKLQWPGKEKKPPVKKRIVKRKKRQASAVEKNLSGELRLQRNRYE